MISHKTLHNLECKFAQNKTNNVLSNVISANPLSKLNNTVSETQKHNPVYNIQVTPRLKVTNQKSSGRCWLFAALNVIRRDMCTKYDLENFEFSQSYLFFWDKLERMNYNLECIINTKNKKIDSRIVFQLLDDPTCDGGQHIMVSNIVNKYGLIPQTMYRESHHSSNSREMNEILKKKFREYAFQLRSSDDPHTLKITFMEEVYGLLCLFLGKPPTNFDWEFYDKKKKYHKFTNLTPLAFYKEHVPFNFDDYVCLVNDPRAENPYNKTYTIQYLNNVLDGKPIKYLNIEMKRMKNLVLSTLKENKVVWFGNDVGAYLNRNMSRMDKDSVCDLDLLGIEFNLNKEQRLNYRDSLMSHAMCIVGANTTSNNLLNDSETVNFWEIENSWGSRGTEDGYYSMSDVCFDEYLYEVAIHKDKLTDDERKILEEEPKVLPLWDPFGALAK